MDRFLKKHAAKLKSLSLILMLAITFILYAAAIKGSLFQVKLLLRLFILNMLFVMKNG